MSFDTNVVALTGRLAAEPDLRQTRNGTQICKLRIAVNSQRKSRRGNWYGKPGFFTVVAFGDRAAACRKYLSTGSQVAVQGLLDFYEWENKKGTRSQRIEIIASHVEFLSYQSSAKSDQEPQTREDDKAKREEGIEALKKAIQEERDHEKANGTEARDSEYEAMMGRINRGVGERNRKSAERGKRPGGLSMKPRPAPNIQKPSPRLGHSSPYQGSAPDPPERRK